MTECCSGPLACPCPPVGLIDVVGKKWAVCLVSLLGRHGTLRFGAIQRALPRVSPATLTATLRALEREGIVRPVPIDGDGRSTAAYGLTRAGIGLAESLRPLASWLGRRHHHVELSVI
ncbi:MAG: helix-turn-helix transcriptional regulator [Thermoplasmata archaeon]|nr:helix-turn-helix transcriptional regulator [Thermoplasmata archaeon]MCI4354050.1 helix-turn-helix transcriptional regulator [Thermoplasmata archaeon]